MPTQAAAMDLRIRYRFEPEEVTTKEASEAIKASSANDEINTAAVCQFPLL